MTMFAPTGSTLHPEMVTGLPPWKVLVVDDEPEVHTVTRLTMGGFEY
jgi:hypothetical protein